MLVDFTIHWEILKTGVSVCQGGELEGFQFLYRTHSKIRPSNISPPPPLEQEMYCRGIYYLYDIYLNYKPLPSFEARALLQTGGVFSSEYGIYMYYTVAYMIMQTKKLYHDSITCQIS